MATNQFTSKFEENIDQVDDDILILAADEAEASSKLSHKLCRHQEDSNTILKKMAWFEAEKKRALEEIKLSQKVLDDFQTFYEEFGSSNQTNAICDLAENECNLQWNRHNSTNQKIIKLNEVIATCQREIEHLTGAAEEEKCPCTN